MPFRPWVTALEHSRELLVSLKWYSQQTLTEDPRLHAAASCEKIMKSGIRQPTFQVTRWSGAAATLTIFEHRQSGDKRACYESGEYTKRVVPIPSVSGRYDSGVHGQVGRKIHRWLPRLRLPSTMVLLTLHTQLGRNEARQWLRRSTCIVQLSVLGQMRIG